jgi:hypothetical protein
MPVKDGVALNGGPVHVGGKGHELGLHPASGSADALGNCRMRRSHLGPGTIDL